LVLHCFPSDEAAINDIIALVRSHLLCHCCAF
jgi:hypothetical protein